MKIIIKTILFIIVIIIISCFLYIYLNSNKAPGSIKCITKYECLLMIWCGNERITCSKRQTRHPHPSPYKYCSCYNPKALY